MIEKIDDLMIYGTVSLDNINVPQNNFFLKEKELELKNKELDLKEKEITLLKQKYELLSYINQENSNKLENFKNTIKLKHNIHKKALEKYPENEKIAKLYEKVFIKITEEVSNFNLDLDSCGLFLEEIVETLPFNFSPNAMISLGKYIAKLHKPVGKGSKNGFMCNIYEITPELIESIYK
jgi:transcriptional regulator